MLRSLLQEFLRRRVSFSIINAAQFFNDPCAYSWGVCPTNYSIFNETVKRPDLQPGTIVLLTDLVLLVTKR